MNIKDKVKTLILIGVVVVLTLFLVRGNTRLQAKISVLEWEKKALEDNIKQLQKERVAILDSISHVKTQIDSLQTADSLLTAKNKELDNQVKKLKSKYEKASNHSINYNSDSIRRYFTDFN